MKDLSKSSTSHSDSDENSIHTLSDNNTHKIHKHKAIPNVDHLVHLEKEDRKKLTKEERHEIQRLKNREAAQKSRDQRKVYIDILEKANSQLTEHNRRLLEELDHARKYCWRCRSEVNDSGSHSEEGAHQDFEPFVEENHRFVEEDIEFQRVPISHAEAKDFFSCLFLVTIILAVCIPVNSNVAANALFSENIRLLDEYRQAPAPTPRFQPSSPLVEVQASREVELYKPPFINETALSTYLSEATIMCLKNLAKDNLGQAIITQKNLRDTTEESKDILFCQTPRMYRDSNSGKEGFLSRLFDIILQADQLRNIAFSTDGMTLGGFPYSGLYAMTVEMKSIRKYGSDDCLMDF